ncbi:DUF6907 domain-containing protein [Streptomyces sp. NPDC055722]
MVRPPLRIKPAAKGTACCQRLQLQVTIASRLGCRHRTATRSLPRAHLAVSPDSAVRPAYRFPRVLVEVAAGMYARPMDPDHLAGFIETVVGQLEELRAMHPGSPRLAPNGPHRPPRPATSRPRNPSCPRSP